jgi:small conductance mechanosensitive channel
VAQVFAITIVAVWILEILGLDVGPAVAGLGVAGIAIGFGAQAIIRDYFGGLLIFLENQYGRGDVVTIADVTGTVEDLTLRRTVLRDVDGVVHSVPNGAIIVASNRTRVWRRVDLDVVIAYGSDVEGAIQVFDAVGSEIAADPVWADRVLEEPRVDRVDPLGERGITLKIVGRARAAEMIPVSAELRKRILVAMAAHGIETPLPPGASGTVQAAGASGSGPGIDAPGSALG